MEDLSVLAVEVVSTALRIPNTLFCPFCGAEYMFEFTLMDHLKRIHREELIRYAVAETKPSAVGETDEERDEVDDCPKDHKHKVYICPFCTAHFYLVGLIPKHILNYHGSDVFQEWQLSQTNVDEYERNKENETSVVFALCSPGLSDIFSNLKTDENIRSTPIILTNDESPRQPPKSILKKTPKSSKIICSPSAASIRRCKTEIRRTLSARRELRFDLPPRAPSSSPHHSENSLGSILNISPKDEKKILRWRNLFRRKRHYPIVTNKDHRMLQSSSSPSKIVTSTPINFLDDEQEDNENQKYNWKATLRRAKPSFYANEKFQCARCKKTWDNNADLLAHLKENHSRLRHLFQPPYRCSLCGTTFFSNRFLVRHCNFRHKPIP